MRPLSVILMLLLALMAGCVSVEDRDGGDGDGNDTETPDEPDPSSDELQGGDPDDDTLYSDRVDVAEGAKWATTDHRFRIPFELSSSAEVGDTYRFTVDVGTALQEADLRWVHPGVPLGEIDPDAASVVIHQVSKAGIVQQEVPVESRAAGSHAIEVAFEHVGGGYILYFDDERGDAPGGATGMFGDASDTLARRGDAQWQGTDLWGVRWQSGAINYFPGEVTNLYATIENDGRTTDRRPAPLLFKLEARTPADWEDVATNPEDPSEVTNSRQVQLKGTTPEDAEGSDTAHLDVIASGSTVTATFTVRYY